jgi:hypothetical protein
MILFHLVHGLLVLVILQILLPPQVFIAFLEVFDVQVLLSLDLLVLPLVLEFSLTQLQLDFSLVDWEFILELLLLATPFLHFLLADEDYVGEGFVHDLGAPGGSAGAKVVWGGEVITEGVEQETVLIEHDWGFCDWEDKKGAVWARTEKVSVVWWKHNFGNFTCMGCNLV